jgi:hypothetical protein
MSLTWHQVWLYYEHGTYMKYEKEVEYEDDEMPPLEGAFIRSDGARVKNR